MSELLNERAENAQRILDNPLYKEAWSTVREKYRDLIEETPVSDDKALLDIRKMLHLLREVEEHVEQALLDGQFEVLRFEDKKHSFLGDLVNGRRKAKR